jgi:hypothetical protein
MTTALLATKLYSLLPLHAHACWPIWVPDGTDG